MLCLPAHQQNDSRMGARTGSSSIDRPLFADASSTKKGQTIQLVHKVRFLKIWNCGLIRLTSMQWESMGNGKWNPLRFNTNHQINTITMRIIMASWIVAMLLHVRYSIIKWPASMAPATSWPWAPAVPASPKNPMANKQTNNGTNSGKQTQTTERVGVQPVIW